MAKERALTDIEAPISYTNCSSGVGLSFINAIPILLDDAQALPLIMVRIFWHSIRVLSIVHHDKQRGTTWLELFAFFSLNEGTALVQTRANAHLRVKFLDEFSRCKALSKAMLKFAADDTCSLLQPMLYKAIEHMQPLCRYGILGKLPMLPLALCTSRCGLEHSCCSVWPECPTC